MFTEEKFAGEVTIESVQDDRSKATFGGSAAVKGGWIIRAKKSTFLSTFSILSGNVGILTLLRPCPLKTLRMSHRKTR